MVAFHEKPTDAKANMPQGHETEPTGGGRTDSDKASETAPKDRAQDENLKQRQEELLDEAIEETFPASDPIAPKQIT
jgi:hypothetical protein